jgi:hypothetical protein
MEMRSRHAADRLIRMWEIMGEPTHREWQNLFLNDSLPLDNADDPVHARRPDLFLLSAGPVNLQFLNRGRSAQPKMNPLV